MLLGPSLRSVELVFEFIKKFGGGRKVISGLIQNGFSEILRFEFLDHIINAARL